MDGWDPPVVKSAKRCTNASWAAVCTAPGRAVRTIAIACSASTPHAARQPGALRRPAEVRDARRRHLELLEQAHEDIGAVFVAEPVEVRAEVAIPGRVHAAAALSRREGHAELAAEAVRVLWDEVDSDGVRLRGTRHASLLFEVKIGRAS